MKPNILILFIPLIMLGCYSNTYSKSKDKTIEVLPIEKNSQNFDFIGFACFEDGSATPLVDTFAQLITSKNYDQLKANLYSPNAGNVYLSTISCEILKAEGLLQLNKTELKQIEQNKTKTDTLYTCSGCTDSEYYTVRELFIDTNNMLHKEADWWIDFLLGKNDLKE